MKVDSWDEYDRTRYWAIEDTWDLSDQQDLEDDWYEGDIWVISDQQVLTDMTDLTVSPLLTDIETKSDIWD
jgi:hypothetical protein